MEKEADQNTNSSSFGGYIKINESGSHWTLTPAQQRSFAKTSWVVTEKVHGANFCMICDGKTIICGKRKEILPENEDFFGHKSILPTLSPSVLKIFAALSSGDATVTKIFIFGEIFGGLYPHPEVTRKPEFQPVQTGIYYSPGIEFYAFDIATNNDSNFIDYELSLKLFKDHGLLHATPLFLGKYEDALNFPVEFESKIAAKLSYPIIKGNKAEGIVIKPMKNFLVDTKKGKERPIIKKKIKEFAEDNRFAGAEKWKVKENSQWNQYEVSNVDTIKYELECRINENRLLAVTSKLGRIDPTSKTKMKELATKFEEDAMVDFQENEENAKLWQKLSLDEQQDITAHLSYCCKLCIIDHLKKQKANPQT